MLAFALAGIARQGHSAKAPLPPEALFERLIDKSLDSTDGRVISDQIEIDHDNTATWSIHISRHADGAIRHCWVEMPLMVLATDQSRLVIRFLPTDKFKLVKNSRSKICNELMTDKLEWVLFISRSKFVYDANNLLPYKSERPHFLNHSPFHLINTDWAQANRFTE